MSEINFDNELSEFTPAQQQQLKNWIAKHIGTSVETNVSSGNAFIMPDGGLAGVANNGLPFYVGNCEKTNKPCLHNCTGLCKESY